MSSVLVRAIQILEGVGLTDVFIPFVLIFTISFVVLLRSKILATDSTAESGRKPSMVVALVMALGTIIPHVLGWYPSNYDIVMIINMSLPQVALWLVGIVMVLLFLGTVSMGKFNPMDALSGKQWPIYVGIAIVGYIFFSSAGFFQLPNFLSDPDLQAVLLILITFGGIIGLIGWGGTTASDDNDSGDTE